jgi:hypothetical protein
MHAKAKTTTLVLWDRQSKAAEEEAVHNTLRKQQYATMEEERPDQQVVAKAFDSYIGQGTPKCALLHIGSDKLKEANNLEKPLLDYETVVRGIEDNHIETLTAFYACAIYAPWVHAMRACSFMLVPPCMQYDWPDDLSTCTHSVRRTVKAEAMRSWDGSGWLFGMQMTSSDAPEMTKLAHGVMKSLIFAESDSTRNAVTGKNVRLESKGPGSKAITA